MRFVFSKQRTGGYTRASKWGGTTGKEPCNGRAKAIFKNANMIEANLVLLDKMINKIMADCIEEALYNALKSKLNGNKLNIAFTTGDGSSFDFTTGKITTSMNMESNQLLHEMFHAYQAYGETQATMSSALLNIEFEAWYAQYLYISKLPEYSSGTKWHNWYNKTDIGIAVQDLSKLVNSNGNLKKSELTVYNYLINVLKTAFQNTSAYSNYPYDYNRTALNMFKNLRELTKDCN